MSNFQAPNQLASPVSDNNHSFRDNNYFSPSQTQSHSKSTPFEQAIEGVVRYIQKNMPQINSLQNFFYSYDPYENRYLNEWEFNIIFKDVDKSTFERIHEQNKMTDKLKKGEIQLSFLINAIESSGKMANILKQKLPQDSLYMDKQVSPLVEHALVQIALNKDVQYNLSQAFDNMFQMSKIVDYIQLQKFLESNSINVSQSDIQEIISYFKTDFQSTNFNKIQFSQGMLPYLQHRRPKNNQMNSSYSQLPYNTQHSQSEQIQQPSLSQQVSFNANQQAGVNSYSFVQNSIEEIVNPLKVNYDISDCTIAGLNRELRAPQGFKKHSEEYQIEEIIKGCFSRDVFVQDHFAKFSKNSILSFNEFSQALLSLNCGWTEERNLEIFKQFDYAMNGRHIGQITQTDIDSYIHFSSTKTLQQIHDSILILIEDRQIRNANVAEKFKQFSNGNRTCKFQIFQDVMNIVGVRLSDNDLRFVTKKYYVGSDQILYPNFIEDLQTASKAQLQQKIKNEEVKYNITVAEAVKMKLYVLKQELVQFLTQNFGSQGISESNFIKVIGQKLQIVPILCTDRVLSEMYSGFPNSQIDLVDIQDIVRYLQINSTRSIMELKNEYIKKIYNNPNVNIQNFFTKNTNIVLYNAFIQILQQNFELNKLECEFIANFYQSGQEIDVPSFLSDCSSVLHNSKYTLSDQTNKKPMTASQQKTFDILTRYLKSQQLEQEFAKKLQQLGQSNGKINVFQLKQSINETMQLKSTSKLSDPQIKDITSYLDSDQQGNVSFHQLLVIMFKQKMAQILLNQALNQTQTANNTNQINTTKQKTPKKVLTNEELRFCQDIIIMVRQDIKNQKLSAQSIIEKYRASQSEITLSPATFKKTITESCTQQMKEKLTNSVVTNLIHYLVREEPARVSISKLYQAISLPESEPPLKQEGIEDLSSYQNELFFQLQKQTTPLAITELNQFLVRTEMSLNTLLGLQSNQSNNSITILEFEKKLQQAGYVPKDRNELIRVIQDQQSGTNKISILALQKYLKVLQPVVDQKTTKQKYGQLNEKVRSKISIISDYLMRNDITIEQFHKTLDVNSDGNVDINEFIDGVSRIVVSGNLSKDDLTTIFQEIDINKDNFLSINEFGLFISGAKLKREQRINKLDPMILADVRKELDNLYQYFDKGAGFITATEIVRTMQSIQPISLEQAQQMIKKVDADGDGKIQKAEFHNLMEPIILQEFISPEQEIEDFRAIFIDADTDFSGFLSIDEFYQSMLKMGVQVTRQEVVNLFTEFDINGDMQIDIDEFVTLMSAGNQVNFSDQENLSTFMKIKKVRKLDKLDFVKAFNQLPISFIPSFYTERWNKLKKNLPSSVFRIQVDQRILQWKDILPVAPELLAPDQIQKEFRPRLRPILSSFGTQITIESAEGVPLPSDIKEKDNIVKRVIRVGLFDTVKKDLIFNTAQVIGFWANNKSDVWTFKTVESLNPVLFRTTANDDLNKDDVVFIFELVVYFKTGQKTQELSCGWAQAPLSMCDSNQSKVKLSIVGGSPLNLIALANDEQKPQGGLMKFFAKKSISQLIVSFKPLNLLEPETRLHLDLMPTTCLLQKQILFFVSGFRNYAAEKLLALSSGGLLKKPSGDVVISCFPKILDSPDILEVVAQILHEDFLVNLTPIQKKSIELMMKQAETIVTKVYPVLFSVDLAYLESNAFQSMCGDAVKLGFRQSLLRSALRFNNQGLKVKVPAPETLTTFKPFNVKELTYEVQDDKEQRMQQILKHYDQIGLISAQQENQNKMNDDGPLIPIPQMR